MSGAIYAPVAAVYAIEEIAETLRRAERPGHDGKIFVAPNGQV